MSANRFADWGVRRALSNEIRVTRVTRVTSDANTSNSATSVVSPPVTSDTFDRVTAVTTSEGVTLVTQPATGGLRGIDNHISGVTRVTDVTPQTEEACDQSCRPPERASDDGPTSYAVGTAVDPAELEERAAIVQYEGDIPREWAEGFARLDPDQVPGDVPPRRWALFVDDVGRFLDGPFCRTAAHLGWGPYELFGADADRPFARIDQMGLLWLLKGNKLIALAADTAVIDVSGQRLTYRRKPHQPGCVLAWELAR